MHIVILHMRDGFLIRIVRSYLVILLSSGYCATRSVDRLFIFYNTDHFFHRSSPEFLSCCIMSDFVSIVAKSQKKISVILCFFTANYVMKKDHAPA